MLSLKTLFANIAGKITLRNFRNHHNSERINYYVSKTVNELEFQKTENLFIRRGLFRSRCTVYIRRGILRGYFYLCKVSEKKILLMQQFNEIVTRGGFERARVQLFGQREESFRSLPEIIDLEYCHRVGQFVLLQVIV